jgi:diaminopimelate decarboxylase
VIGLHRIEGRMYFDGVAIEQAADRFGTPLYIYGGNSIAAGVQKLKDAIGDTLDIYYSVKANPAIGVCRLINLSGITGAEIASSGELSAAVRSGFIPQNILFAGPGKTDDELSDAIDRCVGLINAESVGELKRINRIAARENKTQNVGIRVNLEDSNAGHGLIQTSGGAQKFGIDESRVAEAINLIQSSSNIVFAGLHTMLGSQVLDPEEMLRSCQMAIDMTIRIGDATGSAISSLNFGGGLGVSHERDASDFDLESFGKLLKEQVLEARKSPALQSTKFMIEPGRLLVSDHGLYVSRVIDVKDSGGESFAILDGGIHHALLPITANSYRVELANCSRTLHSKPVTLGGPLCTSADQWRSQVLLPSLMIGDIVVMMNSGAYGLSASMTMFLSRGTPAEVLIYDNECSLIRERSSQESIFGGQHIPTFLD